MNQTNLETIVYNALNRNCSCDEPNTNPCPPNWHTWRRCSKSGSFNKKLATCFVGRDDSFYGSILTVNIGHTASKWFEAGNILGLRCTIDSFDKNTSRVMIHTKEISSMNPKENKFIQDLLSSALGALSKK